VSWALHPQQQQLSKSAPPEAHTPRSKQQLMQQVLATPSMFVLEHMQAM
jgi:hypothetical protein